ncbi:MAG: hypothetical protein ABI429_00655 [Jatrophihabitantaceae bacterium]
MIGHRLDALLETGQRPRGAGSADGQVLGELGPHLGGGDHAAAHDQHLGLASDVGLVPRRAAGGEAGQDLGRGLVAIDVSHAWADDRRRPSRWLVAERGEFLDPPIVQNLARLDVRLAGPVLGQRAGVPRSAPGRARFLVRVGCPPLRLVLLDLGRDLHSALAERLDVAGQLHHFARGRVEGEPVRCEGLPEGWVGHHRGMPDALHGAPAAR